MAIKRMISNPEEFREFQRRMVTVGKIRLGIYETPEGRKGRPVKLDTFRFTSENEALVRAVADAYGGTAQPWTPQGARTPEWEVISEAKAIPVYVVNGQDLDPWYEAWASGRTCVRRCDGIVNKVTNELCVCIPADGTPSKLAPRDQCKPTIRAQLMLAEIQGLGSWLLESHGENAARELSMFREFVAAAPMPIPAMLRLRHETRRQWNFEKKKFDTLDFYVPWFDISALNAQTIAIGGDALTQALTAAGAPSAIGGTPQLAIEARPVSAPVPPTAPAPFDIEGLRPRILADIEACTTVEALEAVKAKLIDRGVDDQRVKDAWRSKLNAVEAAAGAGRPVVPEVPESLPPRGIIRTQTDRRPCFDPYCAGGPAPCGFTPGQHLEAHGADGIIEADRAAGRIPGTPEYRVGDTVTVGGIEFTKVREMPGIEDMLFQAQQEEALNPDPGEAVDGTVETHGPALPDVPDGDYDADEVYTSLMTGASKQTPPLTTAEVNGLILRHFPANDVSFVGGYELARLRAGLKNGVIPWR